MQYNLSDSLDRKRGIARFKAMLDKGSTIDLTEKAFRTSNQNSYLHLIIGVVAMDTGVSLEYAKQNYFKRLCNADLFVTSRKDKFAGEVVILRSSADLTKEEMSMAIDRFKRWGAENGFYLPEPGDEELLRQIAIEMGRMKQFL